MTRAGLVLVLAIVGAPTTASATLCPALDPDVERCQLGVARAGGKYARGKLVAVHQCLARLQKGDISGDPVTVCRGTLGIPPTDQRTARRLTRVEQRARAAVAARCSDAAVAQLDLCDSTVAGLQDCLMSDHWQRLDAAIEAQFGAVAPTGDRAVQQCQTTIAKESATYVRRALRAVARCLDTRNNRCDGTGDLLRCLVPSADGPRIEARTASRIARAEAKMLERIGQGCSDAQVAQLDACGDDLATLGTCLVCANGNGMTQLVADQYQAVRAADPVTTIQAVADMTNDGDTIVLVPGTYPEAVELKSTGLTVLGLKTCDTGARAIIENPGAEPNGIVSCGSLTPGCTDVADELLLQGFEVRDFEDNDVLSVGAQGVHYRDLITVGPGTDTGTEYGVFPILSDDVLIEDCVVSGVRDAGIYVGQSTNIVIRNNEVFGNVAGIEVENSANAEVYGNWAHDNTGGILVFKLSGLAVQLSNCHHIHDNIVENNNVPNFGSGIVGIVPPGSGVTILSNDTTLFENNVVTGNDTFGFVLTDQNVINLLFDPDPFDPTSEDFISAFNFFVGNTMTGNAQNPDPSVQAFAADGSIVVTNPSPGNCESGNTFDTSFQFAALPDCPIPPDPPDCPFVPEPTTTTSTATSTTTSTTILLTWTQIQALFATSCDPCHTSGSQAGLTGLDDYNTGYTNTVDAPATQAALDRIEPLDSNASYLMHKLDGTQAMVWGSGGQMPLGGPFLDQATRDGIRAWINQGAPQN